MVGALIEEYSRRDMLEEEKSDIQNAAAISFLGNFFSVLEERDIHNFALAAGVETVGGTSVTISGLPILEQSYRPRQHF